jgi:hypothetical protein
MKNAMENIRLEVAPLSGEVHLIRVGKDKTLALDRRNAEQDLL